MASTRHSAGLKRLALVHALNAAGDAFFTVSLAGSLFFNVSVEAARPRLLLYLALTMAPFAILAPLIGPVVDRFRSGPRILILATLVGKAALTLALVQDLHSLLMFPEALGALVLGKAYSIARSATVPRLVAEDEQLVAANAFLARVGLVASSVGGILAAVAVRTGGSALSLYLATALLLAAGLAVFTMVSPSGPRTGPTLLEYYELHAVRLDRAVYAMGLLRASVGMLTFLFAFALKRAGVPVWYFGLLFAAGGMGAIAATTISAKLTRRFSDERLLVLTLAMPAAITAVGSVLPFSIAIAVIVSGALALAASTAKHVFDAFVQRSAPDADMARAFARFETRFQLFWISGATMAVVAQAEPRLGLVAMCLVLGGSAFALNGALRDSGRFETRPDLVAAVTQLVLEDAATHDAPSAVLDAAEMLLRSGSTEAAVIVAMAALDAHRELGPALSGDAVTAMDSAASQLRALRRAVSDHRSVSIAEAATAVAAARAAFGLEELLPDHRTR